jgi:hypothetical protein
MTASSTTDMGLLPGEVTHRCGAFCHFTIVLTEEAGIL